MKKVLAVILTAAVLPAFAPAARARLERQRPDAGER